MVASVASLQPDTTPPPSLTAASASNAAWVITSPGNSAGMPVAQTKCHNSGQRVFEVDAAAGRVGGGRDENYLCDKRLLRLHLHEPYRPDLNNVCFYFSMCLITSLLRKKTRDGEEHHLGGKGRRFLRWLVRPRHRR